MAKSETRRWQCICCGEENRGEPYLEVDEEIEYGLCEDCAEEIAEQVGERRKKDFPKIVCLCGSTRFMVAFFEAGWRETLAGKIVLSVGVCKHAEDHGGEALGPDVVKLLDELHMRKIDLADEVLILNVGDYVGSSTRAELAYARAHAKRVRWLEWPSQYAVNSENKT